MTLGEAFASGLLTGVCIVLSGQDDDSNCAEVVSIEDYRREKSHRRLLPTSE